MFPLPVLLKSLPNLGAWGVPSDPWYDTSAVLQIDPMQDRAMVQLGSTSSSSELVTNGDFGTGDTTGWTNLSTGTGTFTNNANRGQLTRVNSSNIGWCGSSVATVSGKQYEFKLTNISGGSVQYNIGTVSAFSVDIVGTTTLTAGSSVTLRFIAKTATTYFGVKNVSDGSTILFDDASIKLVQPGQIITGTPEQLIVAGYLTYSRADANSYVESAPGVWTSVGTGVLRRKYDGSIYIEPSVTNVFWDSFNPATQTRTVSNGSQYTVSVLGSGSLTLSGAGSGTVTAGSPVTFTASSTSLTATKTGSLTWMQCELGSVPTTPIVTPAGASATRAADVFRAPTDSVSLYIPGDGTFVVETQLAYATNPAAQSTFYTGVELGSLTGNHSNTIRAADTTINGFRAALGDGTTVTTANSGSGVAANTKSRAAMRYQVSSSSNGISANGAAAVACARVWDGIYSANAGIGCNVSGTGQITGTVRQIKLLNKAMNDSELAVESARYAI